MQRHFLGTICGTCRRLRTVSVMIEHLLRPLVCERFVADAHYREGHLRVVNALPSRRVLGLHTPEMKAVAKLLARCGCVVEMHGGASIECRNGTEVIRCFEKYPGERLCYEETVVWGFLINLEKCSPEHRFAMLEKFVPVLDNWAVCDAFCANAKWMGKTDKAMLWNYLQQWFSSRREFEVRFAVVASMCYLLCDEWLVKVFNRIDLLDFKVVESEYRTIKGKPENVQEGCVQGKLPYYVRMAVAWLLAAALSKFPEQTREFVRRSHLPPDVLRLYVRKAKESFRTRHVKAF